MCRSFRAAFFLFALLTLTLALNAQAPIRYIYDEAGRLVGVIDANGDAAAYNYDIVGNLLSITRSTATQVRILEFTPNAGPIGQTVTIHGTGFSATAGQNTVSFNGTSASISSASTNTLVVTVPTGATTGVIAITSPNGSANSSSSFVVAADVTPTVTSTTPSQGPAGTSVTIAGTNFQTIGNQNLVTFNAAPAVVSTATATAITTSVPPTATSGKVSVATPFGTATSTTDFIIAPPPFGTGDVQVTYRMSLGSSQNVTVSTAGKVALVLFDATAGQRVSVQVTSSGPGAIIKLYSYDGIQLGSTTAGGSAGYIDATVLTATSSYTILVDPVGSATGTWTVTLNNVPADVTGTIPADGTNYGVSMLTPGQNARLTFNGTVGQRVSLKVSPGPNGNVSVFKPDRSLLATVPIGPVFATFMDTQTLAMAGTYTVIVDYGTTNTGSLTYDALNRPTFVGFGTTGAPPTYASTITTTYDAGDRATSIVDSVAGTIGRTYDPLDRLTQEVTPEGTVNYTYDDADRRATMTVAGQTAVAYTFDNADRLTNITRGTASVTLAYDNGDRRTSLTLPNGIVVEYAYDDDSRLTGLTYKQGSTTIGALTYGYDASGQRTSVGGTYARTALPAALTSATYDDANQIATFGGTAYTYDDNSNLTSDGVRSYTWNARDQLDSLSGPVNGSFAYDAVGRRRSKTIGGATTQFLYDGLNPVQELSGGTPTANLLTGLEIDEFFSRTDSAGAWNYLTDALGSTVVLADGSGTIQTSYTYEPFGTTSTTGASTTNTFAFTGREADGTGLYYYRARYYHPVVQRFVAEDPLGFAAGDSNLHSYVGNSALNLSDPTGEIAAAAFVIPAAACIGGGAGAALGNWMIGRKFTWWVLAQGCWDGIQLFGSGGASAAAGFGMGSGRRLAAAAAAARASRGEGLERLSRAAAAADRNKLTKAGRAAQKHGKRGGPFANSATRASDLNRAGQDFVDDILTTPGNTTRANRLGGVDVIAPDGRGARWNADGSFRGFLEPSNPRR